MTLCGWLASHHNTASVLGPCAAGVPLSSLVAPGLVLPRARLACLFSRALACPFGSRRAFSSADLFPCSCCGSHTVCFCSSSGCPESDRPCAGDIPARHPLRARRHCGPRAVTLQPGLPESARDSRCVPWLPFSRGVAHRETAPPPWAPRGRGGRAVSGAGGAAPSSWPCGALGHHAGRGRADSPGSARAAPPHARPAAWVGTTCERRTGPH